MKIVILLVVLLANNAWAGNFGAGLAAAWAAADAQQKSREKSEDRDFLQKQREYALEMQRRHLEQLERQQLDARAQQAEERQKTEVNEAVQSAIGRNLKLVNWRSYDPVLWARAVEIDKDVKNRPEYAQLSLDDRFNYVVFIVEEEQQAILSKQGEDVRAAVDRNQKLHSWQRSNPVLWRRAKEVDNVLRALPENQALSLDERFKKVVQFVEAEQAAKTPARAPRSKKPSTQT